MAHKMFLSPYVTWSREMSHLSKNSIPIFLHHFLRTSILLRFDPNPITIGIWLQSYEEYSNAKNNIKQWNLNTVFANDSQTIWPTSDSFLLIMSHIMLCHIQTYLRWILSNTYLRWILSNPASARSSFARWCMSLCVSILWSSERPSTLWINTSNLMSGLTLYALETVAWSLVKASI